MGVTTYCLHRNVSDYMNFLQIGSSTFSASTTPSTEIVQQFIRQSEDEIDRFTRDAWRKTETQDYIYLDSSYYSYSETGTVFVLPHRNVLTLDSTVGDVLEVWNGSTYDNYLTTKTEGRANDYWFDYRKGRLFIMGSPTARALKIRIKYHYSSGAETVLTAAITSTATSIAIASSAKFPHSSTAFLESEVIHYESHTSTSLTTVTRGVENTTAATHASGTSIFYVPQDIQRACVLLTASKILEFEDRNIIIPENQDGKSMDNRAKHEKLREQAYALISRYVRPSVPGFDFDLHGG